MSRGDHFSGGGGGGGGGASSGGGGKEYFVDTKLVYRLKQYVGDQQERGSSVTDDGAFEFLLDRFKEYVRKPQGPLRKSVAKALRKCVEDGPNTPRDRKKRLRTPEAGPGGNHSNPPHQHSPREESSGRQRKKGRGRDRDGPDKSDHEQQEVSDDELAAQEAEASMRGHTHNLLNQSVAAGYRNGTKQSDGDKTSKGEKKGPKRPRPGGPAAAPRVAQGTAAAGGQGAGAGGLVVERPSARYSDLGGISGILQEVRELIEYPLVHPEVYAHLGIEPPRGILLHGPPGCGKSLLANAIAGELDVSFLRISAPEIVSGMSGESEQKVRELFRAAIENAPCIVFMDEVDAITPKRETSSRGMEKRIVAQLLTCMDSLTMENTSGKPVVVIGATNRPNDLDSALRRAGRFDREICLGVPDLDARARILQVMSSKMTLGGDVDFQQIAKKTPGFVGADLSSLTKEAAVVAINRIFMRLRASPAPEAEAPTRTSTKTAPTSNGVKHSSVDTVGDETSASLVNTGAAHGRGGETPEIAHEGAFDTPQVEVGRHTAQGAAPGTLKGDAAAPAPVSKAAAWMESSVGDAAGGDASVSDDGGKIHDNARHDLGNGQHNNSPNAFALQENKWAGNTGERGQAEAVGGFLAGPLSAAQLAPLCVTMEDFLAAVKKVQPSAKREGFATVPGVSWSDIGALASVREELSLSILEPIAFPERFERLGLTIPAGVLMYGPPGCGKTLLAKAIANESGANFISVKGPELLDKYVGESEKSVRQVFQRARASSPCIIFFDELDALCPRRGGGGDGGGGVSERVVNQLLTEMDGLEARRNVFVVAATNRPELIDPAMLRPGRLDRLLYVPLPTANDRASILKALAVKVSLGPDVDLDAVGNSPKAEGFSGADLASLLREAGLDVLRQLKTREALDGKGVYKEEGAGTLVMAENFDNAFLRTQPSVSAPDRAFYMSMKDRLCEARAHSSQTPAEEFAVPDKKPSGTRKRRGHGGGSDGGGMEIDDV